MFNKLMRMLHTLSFYLRLPLAAKQECWIDRFGNALKDPGINRAVDNGIGWLCRAQDYSLFQDGGVARHFSLISGWSTSYPETTGYIIPTMLAYADLVKDEAIRQRARRMLDWLISIQLPGGGFQGGMIDSKPVVPVTFNTGQILIGLVSGVREFGERYRESMCRAADWLVKSQDLDGCWRRYASPFAAPGEKVYDTHISWALLEASRVESNNSYVNAALANINWALSFQKSNGWFDKCCLTDPSQPLTHAIGYVLRGTIEAYRYTENKGLLKCCRKTADGLLTAIREDGFLPGRLNSDWHGTVSWACLTGSVQIACCWLMLYQITSELQYRDCAYLVNRYVRRTMKIDGPAETRGAIKGSFPVYGEYGAYEYLNWACKFFLDSHMLEKEVRLGTDEVANF
jgi:hypothetical protein